MSSDAFSSSIRPGSSSLYTRSHSIYGIEDRIVLDIGSLYIKCGFSGEPRPRHILPTWSRQRRSQASDGEAYCISSEFSELYELDMSTRSSSNYSAFEQRLARLLHDIYYRLLLADPKSSKVIILESPLLPVSIKQTIAKVLFQKLHVPSVSFTSAHLLALLTIGQTTGLVVDCGHLEMTVLPIYAARPLIPFTCSSPLAGRAMNARLRKLLVDHGRLILPSTLHRSIAPRTHIPQTLLTPDVIEDIKTRICIVSPVPVSGDSLSDPVDLWKDFSAATDLYHPIATTGEGKSWLFVPGWVRERAAEVLFENDNDDDQKSVVEAILDALCKVQPDIRKPLVSNVLLIGGTAMLPGFRTRLHQELLRVMRSPTESEKRHYSSVLRLHQYLTFADENGGDVFKSNVRAWIGGSLAGSLKTSGPEVLKERWNGTVPDWSTSVLNVGNTTADVQH
ncbi:hypothetical protein INT44_003125 [Umbelopsis vinacea]|uniref:Actin-related protein 10 n=1 Tax=Umbelopsis vinacea TaxID=44442 RepID=A0A8H7Q802_9FUNG|nr:hypothetical protein INT44_003125 [Umbelopsis vinacea]KAI9288098.1 actin family [Umbelopsis sp. AD052]